MARPSQSYSKPCGGALSALNYQANDATTPNVHRATACPWPRGFVQNDMCRSWFGRKGIGDDVGSRCVGNDRAQGKSSKCDRSPIGLGGFFPNHAGRLYVDVVIHHRVLDSSAFCNIDKAIENTLFREELHPRDGEILLLPVVGWNVDSSSETSIKLSARQELFDDVSSRQKCSVVFNKKSGAMNADLLGRINASNRSNRGFYFADSANELIVALGDGGRGEKDKAKETSDTEQTSSTVDLSRVSPYSARCKTTINNGVWDVQCPNEVSQIQIDISPSGTTK
jgi:hypothetical protein